MTRFMTLAVLTAVLLSLTPTVLADGFLVPVHRVIAPPHPHPPRPIPQPIRGQWSVTYHHVEMMVRDQVASVSIDQEFTNDTGGLLEVEYFFPVPPDAAIDGMTLVVNGKEYEARMMKADEARKIYEDIVRKRRDPALLEYAGYGLYKTRAFPLEKDKPARVVVQYKQVLGKDGDLVEVWYPLSTEKYSAKKIKDVKVTVDIKCPVDIPTVYSPSHDLKVDRRGKGHVIATYHEKDVLPTSDVQVFYKAANEKIGATLLSYVSEGKHDGYFLLLVSPNPDADTRKALPKDIVLVVDHSGSMGGEKLRQARQAVTYVVNHLNEGDRFNVVLYSDSVTPVFDGLVDADKENVDAAVKAVERVPARGGTAIYDALMAGLGQWSETKSDRPRYMIFLTDGIPTIGKGNRTEEKVILTDVEKANDKNVRTFAMGVGYDVNVRLLDRLAMDNAGRSGYVKPNEDVEDKVAAMYNKVRNPVMTGVSIHLSGVKVHDMYPREVGDLFSGDQIVLAGRYDLASMLKTGAIVPVPAGLTIEGKYLGKRRVFPYSVSFEQQGSKGNIGNEFVETIWAARRIGYLLDQVQLHGESKEVIDELIALSKQYGILTPYTSFLADETSRLADGRELRRLGGREMARFRADVSDSAGQMAAESRGGLRRTTVAPAAPAGEPMMAKSGPAGYVYDGKADKDASRSAIVGNASVADFEAGRKEYVSNLRQAGNMAIYQRGRTWVASNASDLEPQRDQAKYQVVDRFSDEYFKLVRANNRSENLVLSTQRPDEELLVRLQGKAYLIR